MKKLIILSVTLLSLLLTIMHCKKDSPKSTVNTTTNSNNNNNNNNNTTNKYPNVTLKVNDTIIQPDTVGVMLDKYTTSDFEPIHNVIYVYFGKKAVDLEIDATNWSINGTYSTDGFFATTYYCISSNNVNEKCTTVSDIQYCEDFNAPYDNGNYRSLPISGTFIITKCDVQNKLISGSFNIINESINNNKKDTIIGTFTNLNYSSEIISKK